MTLYEPNEQENIQDALFDCLKKKLDAGTIKAMDARMILELAEKRADRMPKGAPIVGLLKKLPFDSEPPPVK